MTRTLAIETKEKVGSSVTLQGWYHILRPLGKIAFLVLRDRTGYIQIVLESKDQIEQMQTLQPGSVLKIDGIVKESPQTELGVEIGNPTITILNKVTETWP